MAKDVITKYKEKLSAHYCLGFKSTYDTGVMNLKMAVKINRTLRELKMALSRLIFG